MMQPILMYSNQKDKGKVFSFMNGILPVGFTYASLSAQRSYINEHGDVSYASSDVPRFDHDPVAGDCLGLLIEKQQTNYLLHSANSSISPWGYDGTGTGTGGALAPDNSNDAVKHVSTSSDYIIRQDCNASTSGQMCFSVWLRSDENLTLKIAVRNKSSWNEGASLSVSVTTKWKRFSIIGDVSTAGARIGIGGSNNLSTGKSVYIWGAQLEVGTAATSYIPTEGSAVTAARDSLYASEPFWLKEGEGTLYLNFDALAITGNYPEVFHLETADTVDLFSYFNMPWNGGATSLKLTDKFDVVKSDYIYSVNTNYKVAVKYKSGDYRMCINGIDIAVSNELHALMPTILYLLSNASGDSAISGHLKYVRYWPTALSDEELKRITK